MSALVAAVERDLGAWMRRVVQQRRLDLVPLVEAELTGAVADAVAELGTLLALDIDEQRSTPLTVLRAAARLPTRVLADGGTPTPRRDEMARRMEPDDVYDLGPATFADISPAVAEAGMAWGAAKAFVHLRRRG